MEPTSNPEVEIKQRKTISNENNNITVVEKPDSNVSNSNTSNSVCSKVISTGTATPHPQRRFDQPLPEIQLKVCESPLTQLANDPETAANYKAVHNLIVTILLLVIVDWLVTESFVGVLLKHWLLKVPENTNRTTVPFNAKEEIYRSISKEANRLYSWFAGGAKATFITWIAMYMSTFFVPLFGVLTWAKLRELGPRKLVDTIALLIYIAYQIGFNILPYSIVQRYELTVPNGFIITMEATRMFMKSHAYVRESVNKMLLKTIPKQASETSVEQNIAFNNQRTHKNKNTSYNLLRYMKEYTYFLWAPVLVYKEEYPRVPINLAGAGNQALIFLSIFIYAYCCATKWVLPSLSETVIKLTEGKSIPLFEIIKLILRLSGVGGISVGLAFHSFLHVWSNLWAELLGFGDRRFYGKWWYAGNYKQSMRRWNTLVHCWLYTYIFRDVHLLLLSTSLRKWPLLLLEISYFCVMAISGFYHEYIMHYALGFCMPVMLLSIYVGGYQLGKIQKTNKSYSTFIWITNFIGASLFIVMYGGEWYARKYCKPIANDFWTSYLLNCQSKGK